MNGIFPNAFSNSKPSLWTTQCFSDTWFISRRRSEWNCQKTHETIANSRLINCPCACRGLAIKHNESKSSDHKVAQLPATRRRTLSSRSGKGNKSAMPLFNTWWRDMQAAVSRSSQSENMLRWALSDQRSAENRLRCYHHSVLRVFPATADSASSSVFKRIQCTRDHFSYCATAHSISLQEILLML
jgi:hypothetical protein